MKTRATPFVTAARWTVLAFAGFAAAGCASADTATRLSLAPSQNVETACDAPGAAGNKAGLDVAVRDRNGLFRASEVVSVLDMSGKPLVTLACGGPWANFALAPGRYQVMAALGALHTNTATVDVGRGFTHVTLTMQPETGAAAGAPDVVL